LKFTLLYAGSMIGALLQQQRKLLCWILS